MRYTPKFIIKTSLVVMMSGFVTGYVLFQAQNLWNGPIIILDDARQAASADEIAEIVGTARNIAFISFNDRTIYTDKDGKFTEKLLLSEGYNVVKISARDKFGRNVDRTIELVYKEDGRGSALTVNDLDYGQAN